MGRIFRTAIALSTMGLIASYATQEPPKTYTDSKQTLQHTQHILETIPETTNYTGREEQLHKAYNTLQQLPPYHPARDLTRDIALQMQTTIPENCSTHIQRLENILTTYETNTELKEQHKQLYEQQYKQTTEIRAKSATILAISTLLEGLSIAYRRRKDLKAKEESQYQR